ncbi:MAG TPA: DUF1254 domain-containing protein [Hyphomonas sp.]|nr:DUF1254 domain-containing protein [Hyphomonas sp.]HRX73257.1 DUF1254 domain-containing protein [Hyphomonas sp.]
MKRRQILQGLGMMPALGIAGCGTAPSKRVLAAQPLVPDDAGVTVDRLRAAFYYAYPLFEFTRVEQARTNPDDVVPGKLNGVSIRAELMDHTSRRITGPNNDTIYTSVFFELSGGPMEISVPTDHERYFSVAFMNAFTDNFAYIGTRATGGNGGIYWLCGPDWDGGVPEKVTLIRSDSNDVWMLARILVSGPEDLAEARKLQDQFVVRPTPGRGPVIPFEEKATLDFDARQFLSVVGEVLRRSPGLHGQFARSVQFTSLGISPSSDLSESVLAAWDAFLPVGLTELREAFIYRDLVIDGWAYQERGVGDFGENDKLRAAVALGGIAALGEEEAMYFHANLDPDGEQLSGSHKYRWRVPAGGVPVDGFWSLTMYETQPDGKFFLTENPIGRYSIGDRTKGLVVNPDGSFDIYIQNERPEGPAAANWLPAPKGKMRLALRAYLPRKELLERTWNVPPLERVG